jgi:hypothetical protein
MGKIGLRDFLHNIGVREVAALLAPADISGKHRGM